VITSTFLSCGCSPAYPDLLHGLHGLFLHQLDVERGRQDEDQHGRGRGAWEEEEEEEERGRLTHGGVGRYCRATGPRGNAGGLPMKPKMSLMVGTKMTSRLVLASRTTVMMMWRIQLNSLEAHRSWLTEVRI